MSAQPTVSGSLQDFLKDTDLSVFDTIVKDAYLKGYYDRIVAEDELLMGNPVIRIGNRDWYEFNYGATMQQDRSSGRFASGRSMSWHEAKMIPYCKLPSKEDIEALVDGTSMEIRYNVGFDHKPWNTRVVLSDKDRAVCFYEWGNCYRKKDVVKDRNIIQCWLTDELDEDHALTVVFSVRCIRQEKVGDYKGELLSIEYVPVPKEKELQAHFLKSRDIPSYEEFAKYYSGE